MDIIRTTDDYLETAEDEDLAKFLKNRLRTDICEVKITNKNYMVKSLEPVHDFVIHTTAMPGAEPYRLLG